MSEILKMKIKGLYTHPNDLQTVDGALGLADNIDIVKEQKAQPRRGYEVHSALPTGTDRASNLYSYQDTILAAYTGGKLAYYSSGWNNYSGTFNPPTNEKIRSTQANSNYYFTTSAGIKKLDVYTGTPTFSGAPKALNSEVILSGASGFMSTNTMVGYRVIWGKKDANDNLILGAQSQRVTISNSTGGTRDVDLTITIPTDVTTDWFFQVYRSPMSTSSSTEPSDELQLVYEANPTSGEITALSLTFTDNTPESLLGVDLYTNDSQEGAINANTQAPLAHDITTFKDTTFYGNTTSKHRIFIDMLAVGATAGVQINDVITIAGIAYTGKATEVVANREFAIVTSGSASQNIADTARSLVKVVNQSSSTVDVYAYYLSGSDDLPGKIMIEERLVGGASYTIDASANGDTAWNPGIATAQSSTNDRYENGLFWSKPNQPESVPLLNFKQVGSRDKKIIRIAALRDSLFIFKEDGIFRLVGETTSNFQIDLFDSSTKLLAPESVAVLNNQIFCLTDQGVVSVSEAGVQVLSRPIEKTLLELYGANQSNYKSESFAVGYESDRKYILSTISGAGDTYPTQMFVYNTFTSAWTRWDLSRQSGIINPVDDKLYFSSSLSSDVLSERKDFTNTDFVDEAFSVTVSSSLGKVVTLADTAGINAGDILFESTSVSSVVVSVDSGTVVTVLEERTWTPGAATVLKSFECVIEWVPMTGENPGVFKQFSEITAFFDVAYFNESFLKFYSELSGSIESVTLSGNYGSAWGLFQWGGIPWGGTSFKSKPIRTYVPRNKQKCSQLSVQFAMRQGYAQFEIQGLHLSVRAISQRLAR